MNEALWTRVETALDARRDPFEDSELAAALAADPELGPAAERLVERLERLAPPAEVARPRTLAAAAALLAVGASLFGLRALTPAEPSPPRFNGPPASVAWSASLVEERTFASPARLTDSTRAPRRVFEWTVTGDVR